MKYLLSALLFFLLLPSLVRGQQNHVPNGSFENNSGCPTTGPTFIYVNSWTADSFGTPDYYHTCGNAWGIPSNARGFQHPAHGNAYVGVYSYASGFPPAFSNQNELIHANIIPLQPGIKYEVSMSVCRSEFNAWATNGLGVFFYDTGFSLYTSRQLITGVQPQISYADYGPIGDTQNWKRLTKVFIADSAYDNIVVGAMQPDSLVVVDSLPTQTSIYTSDKFCYYYIDSVVVRAYDTFYITNTDTVSCVGDSITVMYETHHVTNTIVVQLSGKNGDFANPYNLDTATIASTGAIKVQLPKYLPNGSGYRIRLITTAPADTTSNISSAIKIANPDSSNLTISSNSPICVTDNLNLSTSTNVTSATYAWTGPNGFNSTLQNPTISGTTTANSGDYYATLKFYGCEVKDTLSVTVKPLPANLTTTSNSPLCAGDSLHLSSSSSTGGVSYSWAGPGSFASAAQDTSIANSTTAMSGYYIVTANLNGCNRKDTTTVLVKPLPAAVTLSNNTPICSGDTLHLSSTASSTGVSYNWTGPGSFSATLQNTNRVNSTAGMTGWYKMLVGLNGCTYTDSTYATVHPIPAVPNISYSNPLCVGETLNLSTTTVSGASYSWSGPNNFSAAVQNPTRGNMQFGDTGVYKLNTTVNGCTSDTGTATVHINPLPFVVIFANPADSICVGDRVNFTALPNNQGGTPAYQWYVNGQATGTGTIFSTTALNHQDVVRVDMTESTKCSIHYTDPSNDITMNVLPWLAPTVSITVNPNRPLKENEYATFTATAANAGNSPQYQWKRNGQDIVGATGSVWSANTLNDNDSISVEIVSNYKCPQPTNAVSNGIVVKVLTGVAGMNNLNGLVLYPNPNNGKFILSGRLNTGEIIKLEVINTVGKTVFEGDAEIRNGILHHEIALPCAPAGLYMLRVKADEGLAVFKVEIR